MRKKICEKRGNTSVIIYFMRMIKWKLLMFKCKWPKSYYYAYSCKLLVLQDPVVPFQTDFGTFQTFLEKEKKAWYLQTKGTRINARSLTSKSEWTPVPGSWDEHDKQVSRNGEVTLQENYIRERTLVKMLRMSYLEVKREKKPINLHDDNKARWLSEGVEFV